MATRPNPSALYRTVATPTELLELTSIDNALADLYLRRAYLTALLHRRRMKRKQRAL